MATDKAHKQRPRLRGRPANATNKLSATPLSAVTITNSSGYKVAAKDRNGVVWHEQKFLHKIYPYDALERARKQVGLILFLVPGDQVFIEKLP